MTRNLQDINMYNEGMNIEYIKIWHEGQISKFKSGLISSRQFQLMLSCANLFLCIQMHNYFPVREEAKKEYSKEGNYARAAFCGMIITYLFIYIMVFE